MPKTQQPGDQRKQRTLDRMSKDMATTDVNRMEGNVSPEQADQQGAARQKVALGQDLFTNPPRPTGLAPGEEPKPPMGEEEVSPEEQALYDRIVRHAAKFIYSKPREVLDSMNQKDMPVHQAVGRVAAKIAQMIEGSAQAAGQKLDPDVMWHAGSEVIEMLMDLGTQAKVFPLDPESEAYQQEAAMAMMEAEKIIGEQMLKDPKKAQLHKEQAADVWSWNIAQEVDAGQASPEYLQMVEGYRKQNDPITGGVRRALQEVPK